MFERCFGDMDNQQKNANGAQAGVGCAHATLLAGRRFFLFVFVLGCQQEKSKYQWFVCTRQRD
jgi:hypothetical protein